MVFAIVLICLPDDDYIEDGIFYNADGEEIGIVIWNSFAIIQEINSDLHKPVKM